MRYETDMKCKPNVTIMKEMQTSLYMVWVWYNQVRQRTREPDKWRIQNLKNGGGGGGGIVELIWNPRRNGKGMEGVWCADVGTPPPPPTSRPVLSTNSKLCNFFFLQGLSNMKGVGVISALSYAGYARMDNSTEIARFVWQGKVIIITNKLLFRSENCLMSWQLS